MPLRMKPIRTSSGHKAATWEWGPTLTPTHRGVQRWRLLGRGHFNHLWKGIADQWPSYLSFATSFLTVGGLWLVHHALLGAGWTRTSDRRIMSGRHLSRRIRNRPSRTRRSSQAPRMPGGYASAFL
jgi:hypothetical protein